MFVISTLVLAVVWCANSGLSVWFGLIVVTMAIAFNRSVKELTSEAVGIVIAYHRFWNERR